MTNVRATKLPEHGQLAEINPASDTGQRWWHGQHSWVRRSEGGFNPDLYEVRPISDPVAKSYVERMHYSGSYVAASRRYGMFIHTDDGPDLVGVAVFAIPAQAKVLTNVFPELRPYVESLELARFVLEGQPLPPAGEEPAPEQRAPGNAESWFLGECLRHLASDGVAGIVSFADPVPRVVAGKLLFPGHIGTIYQASNAVLTGRSTARYVTILPDVILSSQDRRGVDLLLYVDNGLNEALHAIDISGFSARHTVTEALGTTAPRRGLGARHDGRGGDPPTSASRAYIAARASTSVAVRARG